MLKLTIYLTFIISKNLHKSLIFSIFAYIKITIIFTNLITKIMKIYAVIRETYEDEILQGYLIERVFTSYKKAETYERYSNAWSKNNQKLSPYIWKYDIEEHEIDTHKWEEAAKREENKGSR